MAVVAASLFLFGENEEAVVFSQGAGSAPLSPPVPPSLGAGDVGVLRGIANAGGILSSVSKGSPP